MWMQKNKQFRYIHYPAQHSIIGIRFGCCSNQLQNDEHQPSTVFSTMILHLHLQMLAHPKKIKKEIQFAAEACKKMHKPLGGFKLNSNCFTNVFFLKNKKGITATIWCFQWRNKLFTRSQNNKVSTKILIYLVFFNCTCTDILFSTPWYKNGDAHSKHAHKNDVNFYLRSSRLRRYFCS